VTAFWARRGGVETGHQRSGTDPALVGRRCAFFLRVRGDIGDKKRPRSAGAGEGVKLPQKVVRDRVADIAGYPAVGDMGCARHGSGRLGTAPLCPSTSVRPPMDFELDLAPEGLWECIGNVFFSDPSCEGDIGVTLRAFVVGASRRNGRATLIVGRSVGPEGALRRPLRQISLGRRSRISPNAPRAGRLRNRPRVGTAS
jgi:hypothetical protein